MHEFGAYRLSSKQLRVKFVKTWKIWKDFFRFGIKSYYKIDFFLSI